jgi:predicted O-methyltransferase YrrM
MDKLYEKIKRALHTLRGWCPEVKALAMAEHIISHQPKVVVEIGIFGGRSLIPMAFACQFAQSGVVHGIDPWNKEAALKFETDEKNKDWWSKLDYEKIYQEFVRSVVSNDLLRYCYWYRTEASQAVGLFNEIDMLHIDGNHAHESATSDVNLYVPKVRSGGYIWFDDIDWGSTQGALKTLYKDLEYIKTVDRTAVFKKP